MSMSWTRESILESINSRVDGRADTFAKGFLMPNDITDAHVEEFQSNYDKNRNDPTWLDRSLLELYDTILENME